MKDFAAITTSTSQPAITTHAAGAVPLIATLTSWPGSRQMLPFAAESAIRCIEVRADLTGDIDPAPLRSSFSGPLLYTLRSTAEDGGCPDPARRRHQRLIAAADHYDLVDLEAARDLDLDVLSRIPPRRRVLTWQGPATDAAGLRGRLDWLSTTRAHWYRLAPRADTHTQALAPLHLLRSIDRDDVVAYARGPSATWTRVLAARFGASAACGWLGEAPDAWARAEGELSILRLLADYPPQVLSLADRIYGIIGETATTSRSPLMHNTAYRLLGLPALYLPFNTQDLGRCLAELTTGLDELGMPLRGATVIAPHKDAALTLASQATPCAHRAAAANVLVRTDDGWLADNEASAVVAALSAKNVAVAGRRAAVIGCGGSGRAAAAGLALAGADVTLVNRSRWHGEYASKVLGLPYIPLAEFDPRPFSVLINATPVNDTLLFRIDGTSPATVTFDLNYRPPNTKLVATARAAGHLTINGNDMLLTEVPRQFRLMTGHHMPTTEIRTALGIAPRDGHDPIAPARGSLPGRCEQVMTAASSAHETGRLAGSQTRPMPVPLDLAPVEGEWVSATGLADGLSWLRAEPRGEDLMVSARAYGETGPATWGPVRAHVFAAGTQSTQGQALIADFDHGHLHTQIQTYQALGLMVVHAFHRFKDRSQQAGYFTREFFVPDDGGSAGAGHSSNVPYRAGSPAPATLTGTWNALAPAGSRRIATLEFSVASGQPRARADGVEAEAQVYSDAHYLNDPPAFLTTFEHGYMRVHVQARVNRGVLVVCEYTEFTDDSGRRDYFIRECYQH
jgi:3-dehydroquinate dehydratase/shikimate dehydrogenase